MNKQELIKKIADGTGIQQAYVLTVIGAAEEEGWLRNPGEPIDPKDIRPGDRYRVEYDDGEELTTFATKEMKSSPDNRYFLLDRPKPELPTEPGAIVRAEIGRSEVIYTLGRDGRWRSGGNPVPEGYFDHLGFEVVA